MNNPVTLLVWRDAKTDPPENGSIRTTDEGRAQYWDEDGEPGWYYGPDGDFLDPQPRWWCDPRPPGDDAPTLQDVANVTAAATYLVRYVPSDDPNEVAEMAASAARLRAALDALDRKDTP